jgi:NAD(P)-dependent dehydrogenase (short-subunit alcohol dehydrogenase family)
MANILIIAASSDIGFATAKKLVADGNRVFLTGRKSDEISSLANQLDSPFATLDASDFDAVLQVFSRAKDALGPIDGVVNCSGSLLLKPAHLTTKEQYEETIKANLTTAFAVAHAAGKMMLENGGSVVLLSSAAASVGLSNHEAISAAKAGVIGLALAAAASYANNNLRFNVVAPGLVETKLTSQLTKSTIGRSVSENMHPLGRLGKPEDVASAIVFLLDPANSWITGQVLGVDGGLSNIRPKTKA